MTEKQSITNTVSNQIAIIAILFVILMSITAIAAAKTIYHTKAGYVVAQSKSDLSRFVGYASANDYGAMNAMLRSGRAIKMRAGLAVYIEDSSWGLIKIRPVGKIITVWTVREAVK